VAVDITRRWGIGPMSLPRDQRPSTRGTDEPDLDTALPSVDDAIDALPADPIAARAFVEGLFARHHGEIYAYLIRMLRDPELAADLSQDAFVRAYRAHASLEDPTKARAWLYQIANRVALDEIRRRKIVHFIPWTGESRGAAPSAERVAMETRLSGELERALGRIPERQRSALLLAEVHELTGVELATSLGTTHVAARALLTRARESLRRALAEERVLAADAEAASRPLDRPAARGSRPNGHA
jgi:RNA polymerase sigma-70 factor, ECF subfamily